MLYRLVLSGLIILGTVATLVEDGTAASFQSTAASTANVFSAGRVDIVNSPASAFMTLSGMVPGETVTAPLTVNNAGNLPLRYALSSTVSNADGKGVGAQLVLTIKSGVSSCTNAGFGASGSLVYGPDAPLGTLGASQDVIGTTGAYPNGGRIVNAGAAEALCFQVKLPTSTGPAFQGATTTAALKFTAQQT